MEQEKKPAAATSQGSPQAPQTGTESSLSGQPGASARPPLQNGAGAVLLRRPPTPLPASQGGKATWTPERIPPLTSNVDTVDALKPKTLKPPPLRRGPSPLSNVDTVEKSAGAAPFSSGSSRPFNVGITDNGAIAPMPSASMPAMHGIPTTTKVDSADKRASSSTILVPQGPDEERVRSVVEAKKRVLRDRAAAKGRDPNAGAMPSPVAPKLTRSAKTHEGYLKTGERLMNRYRRSADLLSVPIEAIDPVNFVNFCFSIKPTITASAWRSYKPGIRTMLDSLPHDRTDEAIRLLNGDINENYSIVENSSKESIGTGKNGKLPRRTSALKEKRFPKVALDTIVTYLRHFSRSKLAPVVVDWLIAGIATGLRPIEWAATDIESKDDPAAPNGRRIWLYVLNAKSTNGKSTGLVRTLDISNCTPDTISAIRRMSERGYEWLSTGQYDNIQRQCSQVLYNACDNIVTLKGKTYALYSTRHQFVANAKSLYKNEYVSAMCGHISMDTAVENYGKKTSAWGPEEITERVLPVEEEVALIRPSFVFFKERMELAEKAGLMKGYGGGDE